MAGNATPGSAEDVRQALAEVGYLADEPAALDGVEGRVAISTGRDRDGEDVRGRLELEPWEGVVVT
jgi:hypothetical protein